MGDPGAAHRPYAATVTPRRLRRFVGEAGGGFDGDGSRLHRLGHFAHQIDVQQAVDHFGAGHFDVIGEVKAPLKGARGDPAVEKFASRAIVIGRLAVACLLYTSDAADE